MTHPSAAPYQRLIQAAPYLVFSLDAEGRFTEVNPAGARILDRPSAHILGRALDRLVPPAHRKAARELCARVLAGEAEGGEEELTLQGPAGEERRVRVTLLPIREMDGRITGIQGIGRLVATEEEEEGREEKPGSSGGDGGKKARELEERLRQAQKMEAVGRLAGGIAHEFNNILSVIGGTADLLLADTGRDDPRYPDLAEIRRAFERGSSVTRQLLAFSRRQVLEPAVLDLNGIVERTGDVLRRLLGEDIELVYRLDRDIGPVRADPDQIEQILLNVALYARDTMPRGGALIFITRDRDITPLEAAQYPYPVESGPYVMLTVTDTGQGLSREDVERVFEPFFTTRDRARGTGLGLATVYGMVKQSGGYIWVDSEPGAGTTFRICLPRLDGATPREPAPRTEAPVPSPAGSVLVLLVEDDGAVRKVAARTLTRLGYRVLAADDGSEALRLAEESPGQIDLLLSDIVMPRMSGPELAARARATQPRMKVLFTSGYTDDELARRDAEGGGGLTKAGAAFLAKPFTMESLARKVADVLVGG